MSSDTIAVASDHAGLELKAILKEELLTHSFSVLDLGTNTADPVDYPDIGYAMARALRDGKATRGILVCGSGIGISIAANRYPEVRAAVVYDTITAQLCRQHNDANVICFGGRVTNADVALNCLKIFLDTGFEGGRHGARVKKLSRPS